MAQVLILDENTTAVLTRLREYAEAHPLTTDRLMRMVAGVEGPIGDNDNYCCELPIGVMVVFSIDHQVSGPMRHLSLSVMGRLPSIALTEQLLRLLGFRSGLENCHIYFEGTTAVNVLELINPDDQPVPTFSYANPFNQPPGQA